jgi:hypothetical protein
MMVTDAGVGAGAEAGVFAATVAAGTAAAVWATGVGAVDGEGAITGAAGNAGAGAGGVEQRPSQKASNRSTSTRSMSGTRRSLCGGCGGIVLGAADLPPPVAVLLGLCLAVVPGCFGRVGLMTLDSHGMRDSKRGYYMSHRAASAVCSAGKQFVYRVSQRDHLHIRPSPTGGEWTRLR